MEPLLDKISRRTIVRWMIIASILLLQLSWCFSLRNYMSPRSSQTLSAIRDYKASPSEATKATMLEHIHQDVAQNERHDQILLGAMLVADIMAIYFFWNYGAKKKTV